MDVLRKKTIDATEGSNEVPFSFFGIPFRQIVAIHRSGIQYDRVSLSSLNDGNTRQWAWAGGLKQVRFPVEFPFEANEKVHIIYKVSI